MQEEKDVTNVKRRNVIIDCDPGIDDSLAIMLALSLESDVYKRQGYHEPAVSQHCFCHCISSYY